MMIAKVIIETSSDAIDRTFDYAVPGGMDIRLGEQVQVPFARGKKDGFVVGFSETSEFDNLKEILNAPYSIPAITAEMLDLMHKMRERYFLRYADILQLFAPARIRAGKKILNRKVFDEIVGKPKQVELTLEQQTAIDTITASDKNVLLHVITGSGKTEIYMRLMEQVLANGKSAIMLVPEISLTPQMLTNFRGRFGGSVALLHSGLSAGERQTEWLRLRTGDAKIALGPRSAAFAPLENLGLIVVDEEHDSSYISESNPRYDTAEVAKMRCELSGAKLILGSATPAIETYHNGQKGDLLVVKLQNRVGGGVLPKPEVVDMSWELRQGNNGMFSRDALSALDETLLKNQQAIVFLNRRGYASFQQCRGGCGYTAMCSDCDVALTYHNTDGLLKCHYCGKKFRPLTLCPECKSDKIKQGKMGTERVVEELQRQFPKARILRLDNDSTTTKTAYFDILGAFSKHEADILVGTQMVAKGHDFPAVKLALILDADTGLYHQDFRSVEKTYQLITQVAGRSGRADGGGRVIIQTYQPRHYVFKFAENYDYDGFFEKELNTREVTKFPPFVGLVRLLISSESDELALSAARNVLDSVKQIKESDPSRFYAVASMRSPVSKIKRLNRFQIVIRYNLEPDETLAILHQVARGAKTKGVTIFVENNPQNLA